MNRWSFLLSKVIDRLWFRAADECGRIEPARGGHILGRGNAPGIHQCLPGATLRAGSLVAGNREVQGALATFVGAFLYAVIGYSALGTGYYGEGSRAILFFVTLVMLAVVAVTRGSITSSPRSNARRRKRLEGSSVRA